MTLQTDNIYKELTNDLSDCISLDLARKQLYNDKKAILKKYDLPLYNQLIKLEKDYKSYNKKPYMDCELQEECWEKHRDICVFDPAYCSLPWDDSDSKHNFLRKGLINNIPTSVLASDIIRRNKIITILDTEEILVYYDGIYHQFGDRHIKEQLYNITANRITTNKIKEVKANIIAKTYIDRDELNQEKGIIVLENGNYHLDKGILTGHTHIIKATTKLPVTYQKGVDCPNFMQFLSEVMAPEHILIIQELLGYLLLKDYRFRKAILFIGEGANGKSTLINVIIRLLGKENICSIPLQQLGTDKTAPGRLFGKYANICSDLSKKSLSDSGMFKQLTGGDLVFSDVKYKAGFEFTNYAKLIFSANQIPTTYDDTNAFFSRWIIIPFQNSFNGNKADTQLINKLTTDDELSGILNFAINGLKRLVKNNGFSYMLDTEQTREQYIKSSNSLQSFIESYLVDDPNGYVIKQSFYTAYYSYCRKHGLPSKPKNVIGRELPRFISAETSKKMIGKERVGVWVGISWIDQDVQDVQDNSYCKEYFQENLINKIDSNLDILDNPKKMEGLDES